MIQLAYLFRYSIVPEAELTTQINDAIGDPSVIFLVT